MIFDKEQKSEQCKTFQKWQRNQSLRTNGKSVEKKRNDYI